MTHTEQIVAAVVAKLNTAGLRVRTDTDNPYSYEDMPAVVVDAGNESPDTVIGMGFIYWNLDITLWIIGSSATPKLAPEGARQTAHTALYTDRSLGGLVIDINAGPVARHVDPDNPAAGIAECIYHLKYRSQENTV